MRIIFFNIIISILLEWSTNEKFYDELYAKIHDELSDWIIIIMSMYLEFSGDMIWESSSLNQILMRVLIK